MTRRRIFSLLGGVLALVFTVGGVAFWYGPTRLVVRREVIPLFETHKGLTGLRIALLADFHTGSPFHGRARLRDIVERTNAESPDLVLLGGDFVITNVLGGEFVPPEAVANELGQLKAPLGVVAVLGNHDGWLDADRVSRALTGAGIVVLRDSAVTLHHGELAFSVAGVSDLWTDAHNIDRALASAVSPTIVLMHNPDLFPRIPRRVPLVLAGHTHGGQVRFPVVGAPIVPSQFGQRYAAGRVEEDGHVLFVTTGLGTSILPVRLMVPPEIALLTLSPRAATDADR